MSEEKQIKSNIVQELEQSKAERIEGEERINREKAVFAEILKQTLGEEMKTVLLEKKEAENNPKRESKIKKFLEKIDNLNLKN